MTITRLEKYKGATWLVELDDETTVFLHQSIVHDNLLYIDMEISTEAMNDIIRQSQRRKAWEYALYLLDVRDYSYTEMFNKLSSKDYGDETCFETMEKLVRLGMIDDRRYAQSLARKLVEVKKYGYYKAVFEMQRKGIDRELCEEILAEYDDDQYERLLQLINRKYSRYLDDDDDGKGIAKVKNALARAGYSYDVINTAIELYFEENE